jgi:hypothetical protein
MRLYLPATVTPRHDFDVCPRRVVLRNGAIPTSRQRENLAIVRMQRDCAPEHMTRLTLWRYLDYVVLSNGCERIQYQCSPQPYCVCPNITVLLDESFLGNSALIPLTFRIQSLAMALGARCFFHYPTLCSVCVPKSVSVIGEHCFRSLFRTSFNDSHDRILSLSRMVSSGQFHRSFFTFDTRVFSSSRADRNYAVSHSIPCHLFNGCF